MLSLPPILPPLAGIKKLKPLRLSFLSNCVKIIIGYYVSVYTTSFGKQRLVIGSQRS